MVLALQSKRAETYFTIRGSFLFLYCNVTTPTKLKVVQACYIGECVRTLPDSIVDENPEKRGVDNVMPLQHLSDNLCGLLICRKQLLALFSLFLYAIIFVQEISKEVFFI